jgi:hypothetical protein
MPATLSQRFEPLPDEFVATMACQLGNLIAGLPPAVVQGDLHQAVVGAAELMVQSKIYLAFSTRAPRNFDGFDTVTIYEDYLVEGARLVLVHRDHREWQLRRYSSGLHGCDPVDILE